MMLNKPMMFVVVLLCLVAGMAFGMADFPLSTVTYRIEDQAGNAISNAMVSTGCTREMGGLTDTNGIYSYRDRLCDAICCIISKEGYYRTRGDVWPSPLKRTDHPTNTFVIVLKKIINPVPLAFRRVEAHPPRLGEPVAFDLEAGDWVAPDGKGHVSDIWFKSEKRDSARFDFDFTVSVTFATNRIDGIQTFVASDPAGTALASDLMPPQEAPMDGYTNTFVAFVRVRPPRSPTAAAASVNTWTKDKNYIFRVRGQKNDQGEIVEANVGWIRGDFRVSPEGEKENGIIIFNYYYNPDPHSRSLEDKGQADWEVEESAKVRKRQ